MKKITVWFYLILLCSISSGQADSAKFEISAGVDLVNRYVWRGILCSDKINIQPYFSYSYKNFTFGSWASYSEKADYYEVDLYLGYHFKPVSIWIYDYWSTNSEISDYKYFNFNNKTTGHVLEASAITEKTDWFPFQVTGSVFFYGCDKNDKGKNDFSTYLELTYPFEIETFEGSLFLGLSPNGHYYSDNEFALVNCGISAAKTIEFTEKFSIPLKLALTTNPANEKIFFIISLTF